MSVREQGLRVVGSGAADRRDRAIAAASRRLGGRQAEIASAVVDACRQQVPAYALEDPDLEQDLRGTAASHVGAVLHALSVGPISSDRFRDLILVGERRARQRIPLRHVLHAYQVGTRVVLDYLLDELRLDLDLRARLDYERLVARLVHSVFDLSTRTSSAIADVYTLTDRSAGARSTEALLQRILDPDATTEEAAAAAAALGMPLESWYTCVVVDAGDVSQQIRAALIEALTQIAGRGRSTVRAVRRDDLLVLIVTLESAAASGKAVDACRSAAPALGDGARVLVGPPRRGVPGIRESHRHAVAGQEMFRTLGAPGGVHTYEQAIPQLLLRGDPARTADVLAATVGPLLVHDRARARDPLLPVLRSFMDLGGRRHLMARDLHLSTRTIDRRLSRIESLTGRSLSESSDLLLIGLGLAAAELEPS